ncbi:MAG: hypothetical protein J5972_06350 [Eubacterium sp.]|nr:hypothetical protein [Eubacterium sp.]
MRIAFWSNTRGKTCVTSNLACISILATMNVQQAGGRTILFENHQSIINLGNILFSQISDNMVGQEPVYRAHRGMEEILELLCKGVDSELPIIQNAKEYLGQKLLYLPTYAYGNSDVLEYRLERGCNELFEYLERYNDLVFVDTSANPLRSSRKILQCSDLIVVNLIQNEAMLSHFFRNYQGIREKAFYLIGNYEEKSCLDRETICGKYGIPRERIAVIPRNLHFSDALSSGRVIDFLASKEKKVLSREDHFFFEQAEEAARMIQMCLASESMARVSL